jgi:putative phage-type endonuclease
MNSREQFLLDRKQGIGGSDVAAIMGLSPWKTELGVYLDKVSDFVDEDNKTLQRGRDLEEYVLKTYVRDKNVSIETDLSQVRDKEYPFLVGHPDGKVKDTNIFIEAKSYYGNLKDWNGEIPIYYKTQIAHYAYLTDADYVDVAVLADRWTYGCYTYHRDVEFENKIKQASIDFWQNHVLKKIAPEISCIDDAHKLYPTSNESIKESDGDLDAELSKLIGLQESKKIIAKEEESIKTQIMDFMGNASVLTSNLGYKITWKSQKQHRINSSLLKKDDPTLYEKYCHDISVRPFKLLKEKS